jgi:hypothetical protein
MVPEHSEYARKNRNLLLNYLKSETYNLLRRVPQKRYARCCKPIRYLNLEVFRETFL